MFSLLKSYESIFSRTSVVQTLFLGPFVALICYGVCRGIYNVYFHPLRHFPGPFITSVSDFSKLWVLSTGKIQILTHAAHEKYGPVVRIAPNVLSVSDPLLLPAIYHRKANKTDTYATGLLGATPPPFQTLDWREHALKRKRVANSFLLSNLIKLEGHVDERITEWMAIVGERYGATGKKMDFSEWSQWFAYDTVCQLAFGHPVGFVREGRDISNLIQNFHDMAPFAAVVGALPWLCVPFLQSSITKRYFMPKPGDNTGIGKIMASHRSQFRDSLLRERYEDPQAHHKGDFLDNILASKNEDGSPITLDEVKVECLVLMVAGSDTTTSMFCGFVRCILEYPGVCQRLVAEIDDHDRRGLLTKPVARYEEIARMPYFVGCFREALRLHPPVAIILPRFVSEGGLDLYGEWAPPGTEIGCNPYVIGRDKGVHGEDADEFRPERWMGNAEKVAHMDKYSLTWGYGTRTCLAKDVARVETYKFLVQVTKVTTTRDSLHLC
ncbi:hypothetical protein S7711_09646 [Stachybotrys chartarum IBT 7711]|uniref:Uncharacterized protein n=1 Tax=Stachybotrys chartarum (strain CBS 109288 / IBT 7711) TaxID=1280523 RepID=A0A084AUY1_STACB|nr:hypothetical protein S7711_09646 [Stachybotrys chartarum IBT 7711]